jgi:hypothetical protein
MVRYYVLLGLWVLGGFLVGFILIFQTVKGKYETPVKACSWAISAMGPAAGACIGVWHAHHRVKARSQKGIPGGVVVLLIICSALQIAAMLLTLLAEPFTDIEPDQWLDWSQFWLAPINAVIVAVVGGTLGELSS